MIDSSGARLFLADVIQKIQKGEVTCSEARKNLLAETRHWPKGYNQDELLKKAYGELSHYIEDEDIRMSDSKYAKRQNDLLNSLLRSLTEEAGGPH